MAEARRDGDLGGESKGENERGRQAYNEFTAIGLLVNVGEACEGVEELHDALLLPERGVLLERLLDHLPELLGLGEGQG